MKKIKLAVCLTVICVSFAAAQIIQIKTLPLVSADQFSVIPSSRDGMGDVSIALPDILQDVFINPAKMELDSFRLFFTAPKRYSWSNSQEEMFRYVPESQWGIVKTENRSHILTVPMGGLYVNKLLYFGAALSWQWLSSNSSEEQNFAAENMPLSALFGVRLPGTSINIGVGANYTRIRGIDGVDRLYPGEFNLKQKGEAKALRAGLSFPFFGTRFNVLGMQHWFKAEQRTENTFNRDQNNGRLIQTDVIKNFTENLTVGILFTGNWKKHPKIPDYPVMGIPRDPGTTSAFNVGFGLKWIQDKTTFALDMIYQPIDTKTWVEAEAGDVLWDGRIIHKGDITMRNNYTFRNKMIRAGVEMAVNKNIILRTGASSCFYEYDYYQHNIIGQTQQIIKPERVWNETVLTGGISFTTGQITLQYSINALLGQGLVERQMFFWEDMIMDAAAFTDFLIPPTGMVEIFPVVYTIQQLSLMVSL
ncbi:hypothetical protein JW935_16795 [candidate division KSB1 bacterium]|nr:hypothetical protein [candidate division KSB1 bacterium]